MTSRILPLFLSFSILLSIGCGNGNFTSTVHAQAPTPSPTPVVTPTATCNAGGSCAGNITMDWGYCQYETHQYSHSFTIALEIGISRNQTPGTAYCFVPLAFGNVNITGINGTIDYKSWAASPGSMAVHVNTNGDGCACGENSLFAGKLTVDAGHSVSVPVSAIYPTAVPLGQYIVVAFNDDLVPAKPTVISVAFSGSEQ